MPAKKKTITITATASEYRVVSAAAKAARMSRGAWLLKAAEEKLAREAKPEGCPDGKEAA